VLLGLSEQKLQDKLQLSGIDAIREEIERNGSKDVFGLKWRKVGNEKPLEGKELTNVSLAEALEEQTEFNQAEWKGFRITDLRADDFIKSGTSYFQPVECREDLANLNYILKGVAQDEASLPEHVVRQITLGEYHGGPLEKDDFDYNHTGMRFADFMKLSEVSVAKLSESNVLALRLYTTSSYRRINGPLRDRVKPHPFAMTVYYLADGLRKLRAVDVKHTPWKVGEVELLYSGMKDLRVSDHQRIDGGCELAPRSTSKSRDIAQRYASSSCPFILQFRTRGISRGVSLSFLSVYPKEQEYLFPPLTYLMLTGEQHTLDDGTKVVEVEPQLS
jgi:hypothetical protein